MSDMTAVTLFRAENGSKRTQRFDVDKIRTGALEDPVLLNDDLVVVNRSPARTALRDSLFRDILDTVNPFNYVRPY
jgi:polysaccharide export outer membrane protein